MTEHAGPDWAGYYVWSDGCQPRPLLVAACQELGAGQGRLAFDLGCGHGTEVLELLARGWSVLAVDAQEAGLAVLRRRIPPHSAERVRIRCASFTEADLRSAHLIRAGFSLDRRAAAALLDGLQIIRLEETEQDGQAFSGPKHWHLFDILARKQAAVPSVGLPATPT